MMHRLAERHPLFLMVAPLVTWAVHLVLVYSLVGLRCGAPPAYLPRIHQAAATGGAWLATLLALLTIALLAWGAWQQRRDARHAPHLPDAVTAQEPQRMQFIATIRLMLALLATIAVVFTATPLLLLEPCQ